ncbi:MAG: N-acetylneuraminate synthase family protein [Trueperaceae bacterium]
MQPINLNGRLVGPGQPPYVIAEIGSNYNGDIALCRTMIDAAKKCGADAVKFQSWSKNSLISKAEYARNTTYADTHRHFGSLEAMVEKYQFTAEQHHDIAAYCKKIGIHFMSSAFAPEEVDLLASMNTPAIKVASMDVTHLPLLAHMAKSSKPIILSTGMASMAEVALAMQTLQENGAKEISLLHCISIYPPEYKDIHLNNMKTLQDAFNVPVGFSDHSIGTAISLAAIALGACIIEKHFTTDKEMEGWDHWISADPTEMEVICREGKNIFDALGSTTRIVSEAELAKRSKFRRRIVLKRAVKAGEVLKLQDLDYKRPGTGIHPNEYPYVVGRKVNKDLELDAELEWSDLT